MKKLIKFSLIISALTILVVIIFLYYLSNKNSYKSYYQGEITKHFDGSKFQNSKKSLTKNYKAVLSYFKDKLLGKGSVWPKNISVITTDPRKIINNSTSDHIFFVNHSTTLINLNQYNILTDPIWSEYASPLQFLGPKRQAIPGINFEDLPKIDLVLISHNHYDHLDYQTVKALVDKHNPTFITGLGVGGNLLNMGVAENKIIELDWWQNFKFPKNKSSTEELDISFVPAQHFSSRFLDDKNSTLWGGFVITSPNKKIYFAGDTGYDPDLFLDIAKEFGKIDISLLPIGAYKPDSFRYVHINPEEAVKISKILKSTINIPIHYGTFIFSSENYEDPVNDLGKALIKHNLNQTHFKVLKNGEYITLDQH